jgi:D-beta-D-heptose 7-phosphate kinase/D-beta-D-heptose 1-phosphate adenosyltransferase
MSDRLIALLERPTRPRILVVGDLILDRYLWGDVDRISPEAPIPLLRVAAEEHRLGGAGSVVAMLAALEADVALASLLSDDPQSQQVRDLLAGLGVDTRGLPIAAGRRTTVKERFLGRAQSRHAQQMMRVDYEDDGKLDQGLEYEMVAAVERQLASTDLVLISDYNKGVCSEEVLRHTLEAAQAAGVRVVADPIRGGDYRRYAGCACITPNRLEAGMALGTVISTAAEGLTAAERLLDFGIDSVVVTLDRDGMAWADRSGARGLFPVRPRQVYDITGAGDMVLSLIGYCLAAGAAFPEAIELANIGGGLEVERLGVVPLARHELIDELRAPRDGRRNKVMNVDQLRGELARRRAAGQTIAMTNGCFDLLHPGHIASLRAARQEGDCLVVGLNSDVSVRLLKGPQRPIVNETGRAEMLAALEFVDYVVLFDEQHVTRLVQDVSPDVLVKAASYSQDEVVGHDLVAPGGRVVLVPFDPQYSTTQLIAQIQEARPTAAATDRP